MCPFGQIHKSDWEVRYIVSNLNPSHTLSLRVKPEVLASSHLSWHSLTNGLSWMYIVLQFSRKRAVSSFKSVWDWVLLESSMVWAYRVLKKERSIESFKLWRLTCKPFLNEISYGISSSNRMRCSFGEESVFWRAKYTVFDCPISWGNESDRVRVWVWSRKS